LQAKETMHRSLLLLLCLPLQTAFAALEWETALHELRPGPEEKAATVSYPFKNTGSETVTITGMQASCGCTAAKAEPKVVPPGGQGAVKVCFTFGNRKGEQVKMVIVKTSDHLTQKLLLRVFLDR